MKTQAKQKTTRIGMISLGCVKTLVDSELILGKLDPKQYQIVDSIEKSDVALLNTCGFIGDAQKESVDHILALIERKKAGKLSKVIVMGCLVQRFPEELRAELENDVDAFIGSGEYHKIPAILDRTQRGEKPFSLGEAGYLYTAAEKRIALTPKHFRYLKISEGCDHVCTFCTIPSFRGKHRSRQIDDILLEAQNLIKAGAKELILTGQDTSYFGRDYSNQYLLPELLRQLDRLDGAEWIRVMYAYPSCLTEDLMKTIAESKHICHYLDMPLQHASDRMLTAMKRGITRRRTADLIHRFRQIVPDLCFRSTFIVGFPGETQADFTELTDFLGEMRFDRAGVFKYSKEDGSPAGTMPGQVSDKIKEVRWHKLMQIQQKISRENLKKHIGKTMDVLVESDTGQGKNGGRYQGRSRMDAPEIDGHVTVKSGHPLEMGKIYPVEIQSSSDYDLQGQLFSCKK